jgi:hypothetical protein
MLQSGQITSDNGVYGDRSDRIIVPEPWKSVFDPTLKGSTDSRI